MNAQAILNILTTIALISGLFFLLVGAIGVLRLPDLFLRMIAASKCITLGVTSMLLAAVFHFIAGGIAQSPEDPIGSSAVAASTKAILVILFQFVAGPVAIQILAKAAHLDGVQMWKGTLSDDLKDDTTPH